MYILYVFIYTTHKNAYDYVLKIHKIIKTHILLYYITIICNALIYLYH